MKREVLTALGLSDEVVDKIMTEYGKSVTSLKSKQTELEEQISIYKQHVSDRDKQLESLKKASGDSEKLQAQISKLQEDNKKSKEAYEAKIEQMAIDNAVNLALTNAKAKNVKAVRALLNLENAKMDGDTIIGLADQIAKLRESDAYMFDGAVKPIINGTKSGEGSGDPGAKSPNDMTMAELEAYVANGGVLPSLN